MTPNLLSYLAGVLDSSGSIRLHTVNGYTFPLVRICGDARVLEKFAETFGNFVTTAPSRPNAMWTKQGAEAKRVLNLLRPYMQVRLDEVDLCLACELREPKRGKGSRSKQQDSERGGFGDAELSSREVPALAQERDGNTVPAQKPSSQAERNSKARESMGSWASLDSGAPRARTGPSA